ncbi:MAG: hypothetical protein KDD78_21535 [Caldilineaceae bacterium]|nr:hypothetical protein [Caldilineaceae bacterium]
MSLHVHIVNAYSPDNTRMLQAMLHPAVTISSGPALPPDGPVHILVTGFPTVEQLEAASGLQAVIVPFAGVPPKTRALLADRPAVTLHNLHYNVVPTAEMAATLLLAAAKFVVPMDQELRRGDWRSRYIETPVTSLHGKTALILGYGQIGRRLAPVCQALGMEVLGVRRDPPGPGDQEGLMEEVKVYPPGALWELLPKADALICILPLTDETRDIIGAAELARLPAGALLVNVGRGETVNEAALYAALQTGSLRAAGLDVWYTYPQSDEDRSHTMPSRFPFHELENVVMSPHRGGYLSAAEEERMRHLAVLLNAAAVGDPMPNLVNKDLGY